MLRSAVKVVVITTLVAKFLHFSVFMLWFMSPWTTVYKQYPGNCHVVPGIVNGSENMVVTTDGLILVTSGYIDVRYMPEPYRGRQGAVFIYDMTDKLPQQPAIKMKIEPPFKDDEFFTHGIDLRLVNGKYELLVVNHGGGGESVERFAVDLKTRTLTRLSSVSSDVFGSVNDVAWVSDEEFFFTNMLWADPKTWWFSHVEPYVVEWGNLGLCNVRTGQCRVLANNIGLANGVVLSSKKRFVYVVHGVRKGIIVFERTGSGVKEIQRYSAGHASLDNLYLSTDDSTLYSGGHPKPFEVVPHLKDPSYSSPLQVLKFSVDRETGLIQGTEQVLSDPGFSNGKVYASTSAVAYNGRLFVGTIATGALICDCPSC